MMSLVQDTEKAIPNRLAFSIHETADMLGLSDITIRRMINRGEIKASRFGRVIRISQDEINRLTQAA